MNKTWFITGGTPGGFGMAFADAALESGDRVALTARRPEELRDWAEPYGDRVLTLRLDVTDTREIHEGLRAVENRNPANADLFHGKAGTRCVTAIQPSDTGGRCRPPLSWITGRLEGDQTVTAGGRWAAQPAGSRCGCHTGFF
ncbi:SDR family NAD(P)-dependent oxidoreductase [Streptosporangium amethystogenes]|uniref:SDR family NAD(P)-dependent oxidoreductase n=1 Tax=Streptosporangium amethystogenes TaxID=2002 RepID=UPI0004C81AA3|nr:SDR family NAD(P)-dependent oxidoreductase [Streptosporangium amethystogenes]